MTRIVFWTTILE